MAAHEEDDKLHLHMALDTVNTLQDTVNTHQDTINMLQGIIQEKCPVTLNNLNSKSMTFAVPDHQWKKDDAFTSPSFYTHPYGYHMAVKVQRITPQLVASAHILEGAYDAVLKRPFRGKVRIELLNQLEDNNHGMCTYHFTDDHVRGVVALPLIVHGSLCHNSARNTQYLVDDTLYFRVSVEVADHKPWLQCSAK